MNPSLFNEKQETILKQENLNGRVNIVDVPQNIQFEMQEKIAVKNKSTEYRDALNGIFEETTLSKVYFSSENIQIIQNGLRAGVYNMSEKKYVVAPQNIDTLKIIMRSNYLQFADHGNEDIKSEVTKLNKLVLEYAIPNVFNEVEGYIKYCQDQSTLVTPLDLPQQPDREFKTLELKNYI
jgi:hypothetical protein|tara:strand:+ start:3592 stop:4131 length:540 start_codon:yes stop_codon:yes gene_type:complete